MQQLPVSMFLAGRPRTKGHIQPVHIRGVAGRPCKFGNGKDRPELQAWMREMGKQIQAQLGVRMRAKGGRGGGVQVVRVDAAPYAGPVEVMCFFRFERELSVAADAEQGEVWDSHSSAWPTAMSIGDEDTLRRAVLDALVKSGVIADDRWSIGGQNYKRWCEPGEEAGVEVFVVKARGDVSSVRMAEYSWQRYVDERE